MPDTPDLRYPSDSAYQPARAEFSPPLKLALDSGLDFVTLSRGGHHLDGQSRHAHHYQHSKDDGSIGYINITPRGEKVDPDRPTAVFLDHFGGVGAKFEKGAGPAHGELSAQAARAHGYNTIKLEVPESADISTSLHNLNKQIDQGKIALGQGDVVSISLGSPASTDKHGHDIPLDGMPTFASASKLFGFKITRDNIGDAHVRERIKAGLEKIARTYGARPGGDDAKEYLAQITEVQKLQARGVVVLHSAGNDGPNRFQLDMFNAKVKLAALGLDGKETDFSARNKHTVDAQGVFEIKYNDWNPFSPVPVRDQAPGKYPIWTLHGEDVQYSFKRSHKPLDKIPFGIKANGDYDWQKVTDIPDIKHLPQFVSGDATPLRLSSPSGAPSAVQLNDKSFSPIVVPAPVVPAPVVVHPVKGLTPSGQAALEGPHTVEVIAGTSYSNIDYLHKHYEEFMAAKRLARGK